MNLAAAHDWRHRIFLPMFQSPRWDASRVPGRAGGGCSWILRPGTGLLRLHDADGRMGSRHSRTSYCFVSFRCLPPAPTCSAGLTPLAVPIPSLSCFVFSHPSHPFPSPVACITIIITTSHQEGISAFTLFAVFLLLAVALYLSLSTLSIQLAIYHYRDHDRVTN